MKRLKEFEKFMNEAQKEIKNFTPKVMDELLRLKEEGRFVESVCLGQSDKFSCWVGNKQFFDMRNRLRDITGNSLQDRMLRAHYKKMLKTMDEPSIAVTIKREDGTYLRFAITCPFYDTDICPLKDFIYAPKKEKL